MVDGNEVRDILAHPYDFIDSERYYSWERFFTRLLTDKTKDTYLKYNKKHLNSNYLNEREMSAIRGVIKHETDGRL